MLCVRGSLVAWSAAGMSRYAGDWPEPLLVGISDGRLATPIVMADPRLATTPQQQPTNGDGKKLKPIAFPACGLNWRADTDPSPAIEVPRRVGVVCDLSANTIRFFLDDQPLLLSEQRKLVGRSMPIQIPVTPSSGTVEAPVPLVWRFPRESFDLSKCVIYIARFGTRIRAELIDDWIPPASASQPVPESQIWDMPEPPPPPLPPALPTTSTALRSKDAASNNSDSKSKCIIS